MGIPTMRIQYRYDARGNRQSMIDPDGGRFTYSYDARNRIQHLVNPQGERTTYSYDSRNRRTETRLANGTRTSYSYDAVSNLERLSNLKSDGSVISDFQYSYDRTGNRTSVLEGDGRRVTWSYDAASQLICEHRPAESWNDLSLDDWDTLSPEGWGALSVDSSLRSTYTYDPAGNRTLKNEGGARTTYSYDAANQLKWSQDTSGRTTYTFDADGNQQRVLAPDGSRTTTVWDYENRTTSVQLPSGIRNTMAYEPEGLRVKLDESTGTKKFVWDDQNYLVETDALNDTQVVYTNEPRYYGNLISQRRGSTTSWYHFDALGSTRQLTDATQAITDQRLYDAWGTVITSSGSTEFPFQYVGALGYYSGHDPSVLYIRARTYQPTVARWWSVEPRYRNARRLLYGYCRNVPLRYIDPTGLIEVSVAIEKPFDFSATKDRDCEECYTYAWEITFRLKVSLTAGETFDQFRNNDVKLFGQSFTVRYGVLIQVLLVERDEFKCKGNSKPGSVLQREWFERDPGRFPEVDRTPLGVGLEPTPAYDIADDFHSSEHNSVRSGQEKRRMNIYAGNGVSTTDLVGNPYWNLFEPLPHLKLLGAVPPDPKHFPLDPEDFQLNPHGRPQGFWLMNLDSRHDWGFTVTCGGETCTLTDMYGVS